jgi:iron-sulfur cluster repair protein YtfE (RIC family)
MNEKMMSVQDEHRAFAPYLEEMDVLAGSIDTIPVQELAQRLARLHEFLAHELMPHAVAEGRILSPLVSDERGDPSLSRRMTLCHAQMAKLVDELDGLRQKIATTRMDSIKTELQRVLFGLHALLSAHLLEAEDELEPLLEARLTPEGREILFERVDRYAREVRELYE